MRTRIECIPCIFNQIYRVAKEARASEEQMKVILTETGKSIEHFSFELTPPEVAHPLYQLVSEITGNEDPYENIKREHIKKAKEVLQVFLGQNEVDLKEAVKLALIGNAINLGSTYDRVEINEDIVRLNNNLFHLEDFRSFQEKVDNARRVVVLSDNAGESVFDIPLISELKKRNINVYYAVKSGPIINDTTRRDAIESEIPCETIETGSTISGTVLHTCSKDFLQLLHDCDVVIAKGQANFETLSDVKLPVFFLFKVKCIPISKHTGMEIGSMVLKKSQKFGK